MKRILFFTIVIVCVVVIKNLLASIYDMWQKQDLVLQAKKELDLEHENNQKLKTQLSIARSPQFIEEQARNKLFMLKVGEQEIIISKSLLEASGSARRQPQEQEANWKQWWNLFF